MGKYSHWVPKIAIFPAIFQNWVPKNKNAGNIAMELMEPKTENQKFRARDAPWYLSRMTSKSCTQHATFPERTRQFPTSEQKQVWLLASGEYGKWENFGFFPHIPIFRLGVCERNVEHVLTNGTKWRVPTDVACLMSLFGSHCPTAKKGMCVILKLREGRHTVSPRTPKREQPNLELARTEVAPQLRYKQSIVETGNVAHSIFACCLSNPSKPFPIPCSTINLRIVMATKTRQFNGLFPSMLFLILDLISKKSYPKLVDQCGAPIPSWSTEIWDYNFHIISINNWYMEIIIPY